MKISKIIVENYRSIQKVEIDIDKFSVFVGQNNHGKTNFFEAIEWFYTAKSSEKDEHFNREESNKINVVITFDNVVTSDIDKLVTEANKTKIKTMLNGSTAFSVIKTSTDHKRKYIVAGEDKGSPSGFDTVMNEFLPKLEYINTKICLADVSKYKDKNPIGTMLSGVLAAIIEGSQDYIAFKEQFTKLFDNADSEVRKELDKLSTRVEIYLQKQFPDGTKVKFGVNPPHFTDLLKSFDTSVDDGIETKAEDKGDGMQRAIMLSIIQAFADYRKEQNGGGTFLFMIDEAELHLHPSAQRALKKALLDICHADQVLVNTHSSVLVVDDNKSQKIFKVEKRDRITFIEPITIVDKIDVIFELLGGSPSDLLLPRNFLIVEGQSEFNFLNIIIKRFYSEKYSGIKILFARGDIDQQEATFLAVHRLFVPLAASDNPIYKDRSVILLDKPNSKQQSKYNFFKSSYSALFEKGQIFELDKESLEEYYPSPHTKQKGEIANEQKVNYAKEVAEKITQEEFERDMKIMFDALECSNNKAFNPK